MMGGAANSPLPSPWLVSGCAALLSEMACTSPGCSHGRFVGGAGKQRERQRASREAIGAAHSFCPSCRQGRGRGASVQGMADVLAKEQR